MKALVAVKGREGDAWYGRVASLLSSGGIETILLAHVVDVGPREDLERGRERFPGRRPLGAGRIAGIERAEGEAAREKLAFARRSLEEAGVPGERLHEVVLQGKPKEALRKLADDEGVDVVVVGGRSGKPGPHSLGKTARFLVDHAPRAALLVR